MDSSGHRNTQCKPFDLGDCVNAKTLTNRQTEKVNNFVGVGTPDIDSDYCVGHRIVISDIFTHLQYHRTIGEGASKLWV